MNNDSKAYFSGGTLVLDTTYFDSIRIITPTYPFRDWDYHPSMSISAGARLYAPKRFSNNNFYLDVGLNYEASLEEVPIRIKNGTSSFGLNSGGGFKFYLTKNVNLDIKIDGRWRFGYNLDANFQRTGSNFIDLTLLSEVSFGYTFGGRNLMNPD